METSAVHTCSVADVVQALCGIRVFILEENSKRVHRNLTSALLFYMCDRVVFNPGPASLRLRAGTGKTAWCKRLLQLYASDTGHTLPLSWRQLRPTQKRVDALFSSVPACFTREAEAFRTLVNEDATPVTLRAIVAACGDSMNRCDNPRILRLTALVRVFCAVSLYYDTVAHGLHLVCDSKTTYQVTAFLGDLRLKSARLAARVADTSHGTIERMIHTDARSEEFRRVSAQLQRIMTMVNDANDLIQSHFLH